MFPEPGTDIDMSAAEILMVVIVSGIGLSLVYLGAEYTRWRRNEAAHQRKTADFRELQARRFSSRERDVGASGN
jgi:hypothetical protein